MAMSSTLTRRSAGLGLAAAVAASSLIAGSAAAHAATGQTFTGTLVDSSAHPVANLLLAVVDYNSSTKAESATAYTTHTDASGHWTISGVTTTPDTAHGDVYLIVNSGLNASFKASGYPTLGAIATLGYLGGAWMDMTTSPTPTPVGNPDNVGTSGVVKLASTAGKPSVVGSAQVGRTLTASTGTTKWSLPASASGTTIWSPGYQWYAGGAAIKGATGSTYTIAAAYAGKAITVRQTATYKVVQAGASYTAYSPAASAGAVAKSTSTTKLTVTAKKGELIITVHVSGAGLKATGKVGVGAAGKSKVVNLKNGAAKVIFKGLKKGKTSVFAGYFGAKAFTSSAAIKAAKVK